MATKTFTTKNDRVRFGAGANFVNWTVFIGETMRDLAGGSATDPLPFAGASSFDLDSLAAFIGFEAVAFTASGESVTQRNGQTLSVKADSSHTVTPGTCNYPVPLESGMNFDNELQGPDLSGSAPGGSNTLPPGDYSGAGWDENFLCDADCMAEHSGADTLVTAAADQITPVDHNDTTTPLTASDFLFI